MKQKTLFFPGFAVFLLCAVFSCQQDLEDVCLKENVAALTTKSQPGDIDGGTLQEVVVTANYPMTFQFSSGPDMGSLWDPQPWWHELPPIDIPGPGGGGHSPIKTEPDTVDVAKNLIKFFPKQTKLTKYQLEKLNEEYKKLMDECAYKAMDDYIAENGLFRGCIQVKKSGSGPGLASIDADGNLNFYGEENITAVNLAHEWIHLYQIAFNHEHAPLDKEYVGMMEFELAVIQDILVFANNPDQLYNRDQTSVHSTCSWASTVPIKVRETIQSLNEAWLNKMFKEGFPSYVNLNLFLTHSMLFGQYHPTYTNEVYKYGDKSYGVESINHLLQLISQSNCFKNK